jgi:hypothetical protein
MTTAPPNEPDPRTGTDPAEALAPVDPLDERISAALDGAPAPEAPSAPGRADDANAADRARAIEAARDLLSIPPPPLDDVTRRRMVRTALDTATASTSRATTPSSRDRRHWLRVAGVAAALIAVVGAGGWALTTLNHNASRSAPDAKAASGTTGVPSLQSAPVDLHEVSNPLVLKQRVLAALGSVNGGSASSGSAAPPEARAPSTTAVPGPGPASTTAGAAASPARCVSTVRVASGVTPELLGTATYRGAPAIVVIARDRSRTLIFVLASTDCRLLSSQFVR